IPRSGFGPSTMLRVGEGDVEDAIQLEAKVARSAPAVAADRRAPFPDIGHAVLAKIENDVPALLFEKIPHDNIGMLVSLQARRTLTISRHIGRVGVATFGDMPVGAPIILQKIKSPIRKGLRVWRFVAVAAGKPAAGQRAG